MTNINCTEQCIYQKDGKCCLDRVETAFEASCGCAYFKGLKDDIRCFTEDLQHDEGIAAK